MKTCFHCYSFNSACKKVSYVHCEYTELNGEAHDKRKDHLTKHIWQSSKSITKTTQPILSFNTFPF